MQGRKIGQRELRKARNDGQYVIEIVSDAARQPAQRFHLLRLPQLLFDPLPRRDIGQRALIVEDRAIFVPHDPRIFQHGDDLAVAPAQFILNVLKTAIAFQLFEQPLRGYAGRHRGPAPY